MSLIWIKEFTGGLDSRRLPETLSGGVLLRANDVHITRGGEAEKRAAFDPTYALPAGTVGLAANPTGIVVFGSAAPPAGLPAGVYYQQLIHPGGQALVRVPSWTLYKGSLYVVGEFADGTLFHYYQGARVTDWYDGRARSSFYVSLGHELIPGTGGAADTPASTLNITIAGVQIMTAPVAWRTDATATAAAIALAINTASTSPDYTATSVNNRVNILSATAAAAPNGRPVTLIPQNGFVTNPLIPPVLAGGADGQTAQPGSFVQTYGSRVLTVSGSITFGSGLSQPIKWNTDTVGAFFIDMASQSQGAVQLRALAKYQSWVAVFSDRTIQIWVIDSDPTNNKESQELANTGTASPRSVVQFGDSDLFYLDESGIRSLRARDASNAAATSDIGVPIDTIVTEKLTTLTDLDRSSIIGLIEPQNGRFWCIVKDVIYVFSFFPGSKVSAWSTYIPGFTITDAAVYHRRVYVRSGNEIYVYGGLSADLTYDSTVAEIWLPYLDGGEPTRNKKLEAIDVAARGNWETFIAPNPLDLTLEERIGQLVDSTFDDGSVPGRAEATHFSLRFRSVGNGPATLGSVVMHFEANSDAD